MNGMLLNTNNSLKHIVHSNGEKNNNQFAKEIKLWSNKKEFILTNIITRFCFA